MTRSPFGWPEWLAIAATVAARLAAILLALRGPVPWIDLDSYLIHASALGSPAISWLQALTEERGLILPPLYPFVLSAALRVNLTPAALLVLQALAAGGACAAVIAMARHVGSRRAALAAGWCFALSPGAIGAAPAMWSEHLFVPLSACGLLLFLSGLRSLESRAFVAAGALLAAAALTRPLPIFVVPVLAAVVFVRLPAARHAVVAMLLVFLVIVGAYVCVVSRAAGRFVLVSNSLEVHRAERESRRAAPSDSLVSVLPSLAREAWESPVAFARLGLRETRAIFRAQPWDDTTLDQFPVPFLRILRVASLVMVAIVVVLPIRGLLVTEQRTAALVLGIWVLVQLPLIAYSSTLVGPRYRASLDPALLALAAGALRRV